MNKINQRTRQKSDKQRLVGMAIKKTGSRFSKRSLQWSIAVILCCVILFSVTGCFSGSGSDSNKASSSEAVSTNQASGDSASSVPLPEATANANVPFDTSKIIYSGSISLNTENYQETFNKISSYAVESGGFVENSGSSYVSAGSEVRSNSGSITIRVPSEKFQEAMDKIQSFGTAISANVSSTNVSQQYQDIQTQVNNLKIEEGRLQEYLKQATNVTDMLAIENELNRVRTEIDSLSSTLKNWDTQIAYSTIYVSIYEKELSSTTVKAPFSEIFSKIGEGFVTSINILLYMLSFLIVLIFRLLPFAVIVGLGFLIFIKLRKKYGKKTKKAARKDESGIGETTVIEKKSEDGKNDSNQ